MTLPKIRIDSLMNMKNLKNFIFFIITSSLVYTEYIIADWNIATRTIPAPSMLDSSKALYNTLLQAKQPNISDIKAIKLHSLQDWETWISKTNTVSIKKAYRLAKLLRVKIKEKEIGGIKIYQVFPSKIAKNHKNHLFLSIHGGSWVLNTGISGTIEAILLAARLKIEVISIDYRIPPKYPAPAAINDIISVWKELLKQYSPESMAIGGTSSGANIALAAIHNMNNLKLPIPGALYIGTPIIDINMSGDSRFINEGIDRLLISWESIFQKSGIIYSGRLDKNNPYVSPIYGNFSHFPPTYIISGSRDLMLSDAIRLHRALRRKRIESDLNIYEGHSHADYLVLWNSPESKEHYQELNRFILKYLFNPLNIKNR